MAAIGDTSLLVSYERNTAPKYVLASVCSWFGSIAFGTVIGYTAPAVPSINSGHMKLTINETSLLCSLIALGAVFGSILAGPSISYIGRKGTLISTSIPFVIGWLLMGYSGRSENAIMLLIGRFITGYCCGVISLTVPVYIAETAEASKRGFLGSGFQLSVTIGIVLSYVLGKYVSWSYLAVINSVYPIILLIAMLFMPETPSWLISKGKIREATDANIFLHGSQYTANITEDVSIQSTDESDFFSIPTNKSIFSELFKPHIRKPILLSLALMFFQQFSGINALLFYMTTIFDNAGSKALSSADATIIVGVVQVFATLTATLLIDRAGRRILLCVSSFGCGFSLLMMSIFYFESNLKTQYDWIPVLVLISFIIFFSLGMGPIPWLLFGELLPHRVKSVASSMSSSFNWMCAFFIAFFFQAIIDLLNESGTYLSFSIFCFLSFVFTVTLLPETKGKTLFQIENYFRYGSFDASQ